LKIRRAADSFGVDKLPSTFINFNATHDTVRKTIASLTAMLVLQCGIYCACGTAAASASTACHRVNSGYKASEPEAGSSLVGCASHHVHVHDKQGDMSSGKGPLHHTGGHGGESCSHCRPSLNAAELGKTDTFVNASLPLDVLAPLFDSNRFDTAEIPPFRFHFGLPPPVAGATLLSLHCALTT